MSVVIPCYRCANTIGDAVASIAAQILRPAEVLLVDDASGDDTLAALHDLAQSYPSGWIRVVPLKRNGGPSKARNAGWDAASQPYVAFLDADDSWFPVKLKLQMAALRDDPTLALIAHRMVVLPRGEALPPQAERAAIRQIGRARMLIHNPFPTASVVLRRDLPFRFDETFRRVEDFLLWAQICLSGYRCARIEQVLAVWHKPTFGVSGLSGDLAAMHKASIEVRRKLRRDGLLSAPEHEVARMLGFVRRTRQSLVVLLRRERRSSTGANAA